jgi:spermidine synthase
MRRDRTGLLFALFTLSGLTGLVYESVWSHYLKLFLGAAAFAQSFVLAAFMGGMALGAWFASRASGRIGNLLRAYGWIEALIGIAALVFHEVYVRLTGVSLDRIIPALGSPLAVEVYKYSLCALLIVPQTVLLGMTFPLLSGALIRRSPGPSGHHLAMLYFTNSIGAALGALLAAFWMLDALGMPGTMRTAGGANVLLALVVLGLARGDEPAPVAAAAAGAAGATRDRGLVKLFLAAAFVTGAASFIYEISWIRMLALVLGSSFHAFELMLSAFITGLALGGLWIRRRIDALADPVRFSGVVQVLMGLAALGTVFLFHSSFDWMAWLLGTLQRTDSAYLAFTLFSHGIAFAVMLPATFLAGMTLPLFTHVLLRSGHGERAIGQVYAANTLGAIAGVLFAVHALIPEIGVKLTLIVGAAADILLGGWLLRRSKAAGRRAQAFAALIFGMLAATATARASVLDPERLSSGVFRFGEASLRQASRVSFYQDGKTGSVAIRSLGNAVAINTNGKPDASVHLDPRDPPTQDEYTMTLTAALPLLVKPQARTIANIGWGSGLTAEVLLSHGGPREVDSIEIEPAMVAGARSFYPRVIRPYVDRRSRVYFEDAKSYFARYGRRYDVIISEPSNPWVNGVAGLFTTEFYREVRRYLAPGGVLVQWLQIYELNDRLLWSVLRALGENFSDYEIYAPNAGDLIVVAVREGGVPKPLALPDGQPVFMQQLARLGIDRIEQIRARSLGTRAVIEALLEPLRSPVNSDFYPVLQMQAPRARFRGQSATAVFSLAQAPLPIREMTSPEPPVYLGDPVPGFDASPPIRRQSAALQLARGLLDPKADPSAVEDPEIRATLLQLRQPGALCGAHPAPAALERLQVAAELTLVGLEPGMRRRLWGEARWRGCAAERLAPEVRRRFQVYDAVARRDARAMLRRARGALDADATADDAWKRFLLLTAVLGAHAAGDHEEARTLWKDRAGEIFTEMAPYAVYVANLPLPEAPGAAR